MTTDASGIELAPGETLVPGSVQSGGEAAPSSSDAPAEGGDAEIPPPAPVPDASTDA